MGRGPYIVPVPKPYLSRHAPLVCNLDAFLLFSEDIPIIRPSPIQNRGDVAEPDPVSTNLHLYDARYNFITFYFTCPVVLKWDYFSCLIVSG